MNARRNLQIIMTLIGLLIPIGSVTSQGEAEPIEVTIQSTPPVVDVEITSQEANMAPYSHYSTPLQINLPKGHYVAHFSIAGYEPEEVLFEVKNESLLIEVELEISSEWSEIISFANGEPFPYQIIGYQEKNGSFLSLIDAAPPNAINEFLENGTSLESNVNHYIYSPISKSLQEVDAYELQRLPLSYLDELSLPDWAKSELFYSLVSPLGEYALVPQYSQLDSATSSLWIVDLGNREMQDLGIMMTDSQLPWQAITVNWAADGSSAIISDRGGQIASFITFGENVTQAKVTPILDMIKVVLPNIQNIWFISATPNLSKILFFTSTSDATHNLVVVDTKQSEAYLLPISDRYYGSGWYRSNLLVILNENGFNEIEFPSLAVHEIQMSDQIPLQTIDNVYFPPDFSYMIVDRSEYYGAALLIYNLGDTYSPSED